MDKRITSQFGLWKSPISPVHMAQGLRLIDLAWADDGSLVWLEGRGDRNVLVISPPNRQAQRELSSSFSVRAKVGYGGGDFSVFKNNVIFADAESGRLYRLPLHGGQAHPVTPGYGAAAAPVVSPDGAWMLFIRSYEGQDSLEIVDTQGVYWPQKLVSGNDFYMQPVWAADGKRIAWISWDHPNMPWDGTDLWLGDLEFSPGQVPSLVRSERLAGGKEISIFQPDFSADGRYLAYASDEGGWWQLYVYDLLKGHHVQLTNTAAEHGAPGWAQGLRTYGFSPDSSRLFFIRNEMGQAGLWQLYLETGKESQVFFDENYSSLDQIAISPFGIGMIASAGDIPGRVITCPLPVREEIPGTRQIIASEIIRRATTEEFIKDDYAKPQPITWKGLDGEAAHGLYFQPCNPKFSGIGAPPLIVHVHGGPTSQVKNAFNMPAQFFTSRGYAYLEVNYRGSTGFGREYRNKLRSNWGIYDVQDSVSGAQSLAESGQVDGERIVIMGGSAGGFTVYKALQDYPEFFRAGICLYGVSNQFALAAETHKFEAHYTDSLIGPLPEAAALYRERSPINFVDKIRRPLAVFQGEDDRVVPRNQSDELVEVLRRKGIPYIYHVYSGEGHGFRKPETISHMFKAVEKFLQDYVIYF